MRVFATFHQSAAGALALCFALCLALPALAQTEPVIGLWKTIDEKTGETSALVRISADGGKFAGKLETIFPALKPGATGPLCEKCEGDKRNQPIQGLLFMWGFVKEGQEYLNGRILDPNTGGIYSAKMSVSEDGDKLNLHGYIGIPLFGRSQTWLRAKTAQQ